MGDLAAAVVMMQADGTRQSAQIAVMKQQLDMQKSVLTLLDPSASKAPAPPGMGLAVDKTA